MRVHSLQLAYGDDETMSERIARVARLVRAQCGADLVVLPELWAPGGFSYREWGHRAQGVDGPIVAAIAEAAREIGAYVHAGSIIEADAGAAERIAAAGGDVKELPELPEGERGLWNTSVLLDPQGEVVATYRKIHRFGFGSGEPKLLDAGTEVVTAPLTIRGREVTVGLATCYDLRFPELFRSLLDAGAEVALVPAAWPAPRVDHWSLFARARATEDFMALVAVNTAGFHARTPMGGRSVTLGADGSVLAEAGADETVLVADIDLDAIATRREDFPALADRRMTTAGDFRS